jgi:hypothetical protein
VPLRESADTTARATAATFSINLLILPHPSASAPLITHPAALTMTCLQRAGRHVTLRAPRLEGSCPHYPRTRRGASPSIYPPPRIFSIELSGSHSSFVLDAPLPAHTYLGGPLQLPVPPAAASKRPLCTYSGRENEDCVVPALGGPGGRTRRNATPSSSYHHFRHLSFALSLPLLLHVFLAHSSTPVCLFLCSCVFDCSKIALITHLLALRGILSSLQTSWIAGLLRGWGAKAEAWRVCSAAVARGTCSHLLFIFVDSSCIFVFLPDFSGSSVSLMLSSDARFDVQQRGFPVCPIRALRFII